MPSTPRGVALARNNTRQGTHIWARLAYVRVCRWCGVRLNTFPSLDLPHSTTHTAKVPHGVPLSDRPTHEERIHEFFMVIFFLDWYDRSGNRMEHLHIRPPLNAIHRLTILARRNSYAVLRRIQLHHKNLFSNSLLVPVSILDVMCFFPRRTEGRFGGS